MARITSSKKEKKTSNSNVLDSLFRGNDISNIFIKLGLFIFVIGLIIFILTFFPVIKEEFKYFFRLYPISSDYIRFHPSPTPVSSEFGIVIQKILANARVVDNVDPFNASEYQLALTKGVAHAKGTSYPGNAGNTFIFAHSSANWFTANQYNSVFYLVNKLEKGDKIKIYYKNKKFDYEVFDKKIVEASATEYLKSICTGQACLSPTSSILTLMTCWPPGTSLKRLIIQAKITFSK